MVKFVIVSLFYFCMVCTSYSDDILLFNDLDHIKLSKIDHLENESNILLGKVETLEYRLSLLERIISDNKRLYINQSHLDNIKDIFSSVLSDEKTLYDLALLYFHKKDYKLAESKFVEFIISYPNSNLRDKAMFWYAEIYFKQKIFDKSAIFYLKTYEEYPDSDKAYEALLKLGISLGNLNKNKCACTVLNKLSKSFNNMSSALIKEIKDNQMKFNCK